MQDAYYMDLVDQTFEAILVFDKNGNVVFGNRTAVELLGYKEWNVRIDEIFPDAFTCTSDGVEWGKGVGRNATIQTTHRKNRTNFDMQLRVVYVEKENITICFGLDVSSEAYYTHKLKEADSQIESAETMKNRFVANVSHELRTPVNGILGNVQTLLREETDPQKLATLHLIERGCNEMHSHINGILDYSKLNEGKLELDPKEFEFREMIEYIKTQHINKITEKGLGFVVEVAEDVPQKVIGDELRIGEILNNLLSNACKFTSVGKITMEIVKTAQRGNAVELFFMVSDTGIGIARADQDKLFESFSQVDASTFRKYGGTGLGLSIAKQLVEMMGGKVRVDSVQGEGSMFSFHIWLRVPNDILNETSDQIISYKSEYAIKKELMKESEQLYEFNTAENIAELKKKMSKLVLCIEMKNWEKAETFAEAVRQLVASAPPDIKSLGLRMKMAVQKADYDKAIAAHGKLNEALNGLE